MSIKEKGLLQPIIVRFRDDLFEIVGGNRRYQACKLLGWKKVSCHILELDDRESFELSLAENIQRKSMTILEEAEAYQKYANLYGRGGISELAKKIGKSPSYVSKRIAILDLPNDVLHRIKQSEISPSVAEELLPLGNGERQSELALLISKRKLSMKNVRALVGNQRECIGSEDDRQICDLKSSEIYSVMERKESFVASLDRIISSLRIALIEISSVVESEDDEQMLWFFREVLMQHKLAVHSQIDLLLRQKRRLIINVKRLVRSLVGQSLTGPKFESIGLDPILGIQGFR
jgi:ParB family chromosome partitioning protein